MDLPAEIRVKIYDTMFDKIRVKYTVATLDTGQYGVINRRPGDCHTLALLAVSQTIRKEALHFATTCPVSLEVEGLPEEDWWHPGVSGPLFSFVTSEYGETPNAIHYAASASSLLGNGPLYHNLRSVEIRTPLTRIMVNRSRGLHSMAYDLFQEEVLQGYKLFPADDRHLAQFLTYGWSVKSFVESSQVSLTLHVEIVAFEWHTPHECLETSIQAVSFSSLAADGFHHNNRLGGGVG